MFSPLFGVSCWDHFRDASNVNSPNRSLTVGVLALSTAGGRSLTELGSADAQNVAKTVGFTTFAKIIHLWQK